MFHERAVDVCTSRVGFRMPLHAEVTPPHDRFDDTVRCFCPHFETIRQQIDRLMMTRCHDVFARRFHTKEVAVEDHFMLRVIMSYVVGP